MDDSYDDVEEENKKREAIIDALNKSPSGIMVRDVDGTVGLLTSSSGNIATRQNRKYFFKGEEIPMLDLGDFTIVSTAAAAAAGRRRRKTRKTRRKQRGRKTRSRRA